MSQKSPDIIVQGATHNNLKNVSLSVTPGELTVITGLSGTGKSTLLFDVLHAEGQRRYVETFSPYVRQFLDTLPRPEVEAIHNARPSIAVEQKNSIRNSRSTVGTMTELCDYFKVWFSESSCLFDPINGERIVAQSPRSFTNSVLSIHQDSSLYIGFTCTKPTNLEVKDFFIFLQKAGHNRIFRDGSYVRLDSIKNHQGSCENIFVVVDRIQAKDIHQKRIQESIQISLELGKGVAELRNSEGGKLETIVHGLRSKQNLRIFKEAQPNLFSFNTPQGACPNCKGFGKTISIDPGKVVPDKSLSIQDGAIKAFTGRVYSHCKEDLLGFCKEQGVDPSKPFSDLTEKELRFIWDGDKNYKKDDQLWYGIFRFFSWLEKKTYKMHVRVFLSKYRGYFTCHECNGTRLVEESSCWKWKGYILPELYAMPVEKLISIMPKSKKEDNSKKNLALDGIHTRLQYLLDVGLGYISLDRPAKTLSGGETQRVNLTTCLGSALTDALFALDEPTIGLHGKDIGKLIGILKKLAAAGNCVCVVEHDEQVIQCADKIIEIGPKPGSEGGHLIFHGPLHGLLNSKKSATSKWLNLSNKYQNTTPNTRKNKASRGLLRIKKASLNNLKNVSVNLPLGKLVCVAGVSGSGKSTLINEIVYQELSGLNLSKSVQSDEDFNEVLLVDQNTISKTPRSNAILYADGWSPIKEALGRSDDAKRLGYFSSDFSFNAGNGRCEECMGLGYNVVEMQFLSDVQIPCNYCNGMRFKEDILSVKLGNLSVFDILNLSVNLAIEEFSNFPKTFKKLKLLQDVGLGYLKLGQPLNTLSGGESQRLKLVKYMGGLKKATNPSLLLIDEPTTGLHMQDVGNLIEALRTIVDAGHSLIVIEHNTQLLMSSDWILEIGPGAGSKGGKIVAEGTPSSYKKKKTETGKFLFSPKQIFDPIKYSESPNLFSSKSNEMLKIIGANENNLKNVSLVIPHKEFVVITGPSGSGKSSLAFDVIFAEGQRRFMESMSSYARQFIEQMGKPNVDKIEGMPPTVALEQRITRGSRKSTVGSITEVTQYLRLLYARIGIQLNEAQQPLEKASLSQIEKKVQKQVKENFKNGLTKQFLLSPLINGRKGHHKPIVNWATNKGFEQVRCDKEIFQTKNFMGLDRYSIHDIEAVVAEWDKMPSPGQIKSFVQYALEIGKGRCLLADVKSTRETWFSTKRVDPLTGISYPELEPSHFSWNSSKGRCGYCKGYGKIYDWMKDDLPASGEWWKIEDGSKCPKCLGTRLGQIARNVVLFNLAGDKLSLPELLALPPELVLQFLQCLKVNKFEQKIADSTIPEISERLNFMNQVGLDYLCLNRDTSSLSGGEAQRIRLAGQLGSNLSGILYVLDEPSIGLHPRDNQRLLNSLRSLQSKGNSLIVVEHDQETIEQADYIIEVGPFAGKEGGKIVKASKVNKSKINEQRISYKKSCLAKNKSKLPAGKKNPKSVHWLRLKNAKFRNIHDVSVDIPLGYLTVCCGISGSGKSTIVRGIIFENVKKAILEGKQRLISPKGILIRGNSFGQAIEVDQKPIGKTSRSTPVTYLGIWDRIRNLFAQLPESKALGLVPSTFSFNVKGGRCETCKGNGRIKLEMNFLPDAYVTCTNCNGSRYKDEILDLKWNNKNISQILDLSMEEAVEFFQFDYFLQHTFELMTETGLGYIKLGQASPTLSGGEAQRLKLASELSKSIDKSKISKRPKSRPTLFVLEEPTIGLHHADRTKLFHLLRRLVDEGNTVIVIEHDIDLIANADYIFEMGPGGGLHGGKQVFQGTPSELADCKTSPTSSFIKKFMR
ncbi:MAG: excinuclease ABC subunit UvrA [Opitutales bacterium]|nr:excinuclease ABC subunit UvrA [Opitutales bacterium]